MVDRANRLPVSDLRLSGWQIVLIAAAVTLFALATVMAGVASGLLVWAPTTDRLLLTALTAVFVPSIFEELVFRLPLLFTLHRARIAAVIWATAGFSLWHIVEGTTFLSAAAEWFLDPVFLVITLMFGGLTTMITLMTRRLWPAILLHWAMVVAWKQLLGGPSFLGTA